MLKHKLKVKIFWYGILIKWERIKTLRYLLETTYINWRRDNLHTDMLSRIQTDSLYAYIIRRDSPELYNEIMEKGKL